MEDHKNTININSSTLLSQTGLGFFIYAVKSQNSTRNVEAVSDAATLCRRTTQTKILFCKTYIKITEDKDVIKVSAWFRVPEAALI